MKAKRNYQYWTVLSIALTTTNISEVGPNWTSQTSSKFVVPLPSLHWQQKCFLGHSTSYCLALLWFSSLIRAGSTGTILPCHSGNAQKASTKSIIWQQWNIQTSLQMTVPASDGRRLFGRSYLHKPVNDWCKANERLMCENVEHICPNWDSWVPQDYRRENKNSYPWDSSCHPVLQKISNHSSYLFPCW